MQTKKCWVFIAAAVLAVVFPGCSKQPEPAIPAVASPTCADLDKITDPAQHAELLKKCPRSGTQFKPSQKKEY
jgi:entry exclusion lipoprotein TrbK